ncbi:MAG: glycosyltransferase family 4 protein [Sphingomonas sp.]|nr:glycosyltransferase family 4 protein [Sphingomonas sp.]
MRILFALAGLHRVDRGAEVAFISVASQLARQGEEVTLIGSGPKRPGREYRYIRAASIPRQRFERWPSLPLFRNETGWEEASFIPGLLKVYRPSDYDVTLTCAYPWTNWALRRPAGPRPAHVFVTQTGDWPAYSDKAEFGWFDCDGLICTNPDYLERNHERFRSALIPNGVDTKRFTPGLSERECFGISTKNRVVLMVSALIASKNVDRAIHAISRLPEVTLVVAGDGPLRDDLGRLAQEQIPGRYQQLTVPAADMPSLYRSADAFLHLSRDESFGNVFVEAMACGTPIVAYDLPRTRWILGDQGCLAGSENAEELAERIEQAMAGRDRTTKTLVDRASEFDWSSIAGQYRDFLEQVVAGRGRA